MSFPHQSDNTSTSVAVFTQLSQYIRYYSPCIEKVNFPAKLARGLSQHRWSDLQVKWPYHVIWPQRSVDTCSVFIIRYGLISNSDSGREVPSLMKSMFSEGEKGPISSSSIWWSAAYCYWLDFLCMCAVMATWLIFYLMTATGYTPTPDILWHHPWH